LPGVDTAAIAIGQILPINHHPTDNKSPSPSFKSFHPWFLVYAGSHSDPNLVKEKII
jgi:hypothetical protein